MATILIFDPRPLMQDKIGNLCSVAGHQIATPSGFVEMMERIHEHSFDLILIGVNRFHEEEGLALLKTLLKKSGRQTPVVAYTESLDADFEKKAFQTGALDIVRETEIYSDWGRRLDKLLHHAKESRQSMGRPKSTSKTILIVDDEAPIRKLLQTFFQSKGYVTLEAASGAEAIDLVRSEKPALVLLDVRMPGMDGIETLKKILEIQPSIGVVMASGLQDETVAREATRLGAYAYVLKPFDFQYLELVVLARLLMAA